jgi:peptidoglycan/LPS O-acetylase OafA/YrhL
MLGALSIDGRPSPLDRAIVAWAVAFAVAAASFRFLEQPALALKSRLAVERAGAAPAVARYRTT